MKLLNIDIPEKSIPQREEIFLSLIQDNKYNPIIWKEITYKENNTQVSLFVSNDALKIDNVRINVTHKLAQEITNTLGLIMITDKIADLIHKNATEIITPCIQSDSVKNNTMSFTSNMLRHSNEVDKKIKNPNALISTTGKHWIQHNRLYQKQNWGVNYGWFDKSAPYTSQGKLKLHQTVGGAHNVLHVDYSQTYTPVHPICFINGEQQSLFDIYTNDNWNLVSYEKLKGTQHPNIPNNNFHIAELIC